MGPETTNTRSDNMVGFFFFNFMIHIIFYNIMLDFIGALLFGKEQLR